jgi:hypothetical protein
MESVGIIEGFFGPQWSHDKRKSYAHFLSLMGGGFYIYAPKQDPYLRKNWRDQWSTSYIDFLKNLVTTFHQEKILFGIGFSPFGLGLKMNDEDRLQLIQKLTIINTLKIDILGIFFDDMPTNDNLAKIQLEALSLVRGQFSGKIIFCPSYYSTDPLLDKVFGERPANYLNQIGDGLPLDISIAWTGPQVISPEITVDHLKEVSLLLGRRPFIWENFFANDGPKNCKFLKLKPFTGRTHDSFLNAEAFGLNMMNQPELSKILFLSAQIVCRGENNSEKAFRDSLSRLCSPSFSEFILKNGDKFLTQGLDNISHEVKSDLLHELKSFKDPAAQEISDWLKGKFIVGSECLTD